MGLFSEDLKTSITLYIDNLSNFEEIEWYQFQQLTESISMQPSGAKEAVEAVRKRLKHGTIQQKINVLKVLRLLMENSNQRFHRELISNEKLKERFELIIESPSEDVRVRKLLMTLLGTWSVMFKDERQMRVIQQMFETGKHYFRLKQPGKSPDQQRQGAVPASNDTGATRQPFDFDQYKPEIIQEIALAVQSANNLIYALQLINTEQNDWESDLESIRQLYERCKETKQRIVRYARLVEDEEWIGTLLAANEDLLKAINMHDLMVTGQVSSDEHERLLLKESSNNHQSLAIQELEDPFADPF